MNALTLKGRLFYCNESLSVTVTDELIEPLVQVYFYQQHKFSCSPRYSNTSERGVCACVTNTCLMAAPQQAVTRSDVLRVAENFTNRNMNQTGFSLILFIKCRVGKLIKNLITLKTFSPLKGHRADCSNLHLLMAATVIANNILLICRLSRSDVRKIT